MSGLFRMLKLVMSYPRRLVWFVVVSIIFGGFSASFALIMKAITGILENEKTREIPSFFTNYFPGIGYRRAFYWLLALTAIILLLKCVAQYFRRYLEAWLTYTVVKDMQTLLANHLLSLDLGFFQSERAGDLLSRLTNDLLQLSRSVKLLCILMTRPITLIWFLGVMFYMNYKLALLGLVAAPLGAVVIGKLSRKMRRAAKSAQSKRADITSVMVQFLVGMKVVKAFACEDFEGQQVSSENTDLFNVTMKRERARARVRPVVEFVSSVGALLAIAVGGEWVFNGTLELKDMAGFLAALGLMYAPAKELSKANNDIQESLPGAERVFEILDMKQEVIDGTRELDEFSGSIKFKDVSFSYVKDTPVLNNIDLEIKKGECVALVGRSGAGKSTLTDLVLRFFDPCSGRILVDGIDLREVTFASLRDKIALVSQNPFLFNCSIKDNIAYGRSDAGMEKIIVAAEAANIHDDILALPQGYDTRAGERGDNLSGGQRQRVAIARAIYKDAPILILDEATSSLDSESEKAVQVALEHLMKGRTSIVIAHRLSTIRHADRIVVMDEGRIVDIGSHDDLLGESEIYSRLVEIQTGVPSDLAPAKGCSA